MVEIHVQLTSAMVACQAALLDLINACIKELKRCTTAVRQFLSTCPIHMSFYHIYSAIMMGWSGELGVRGGDGGSVHM